MPHGQTGPAYTCLVPHCTSPASGRFGVHCSKHTMNSYRNGHPEQSAILKRDLAPHLKEAHGIIERNRENLFNAVLKKRWDLMVETTDQILADYDSGRAVSAEQLKAARCLHRIYYDVPFEEVIVAYLAMHIFRDARPRAIKSDQAFDSQVVLYIRKLSPQFADTYYMPSGRMKSRVYRPMGVLASKVMASWLHQVFGDVAQAILLKLKDRVRVEVKAKEDFRQALSQIVVD